jgi:hypothetical protein
MSESKSTKNNTAKKKTTKKVVKEEKVDIETTINLDEPEEEPSESEEEEYGPEDVRYGNDAEFEEIHRLWDTIDNDEFARISYEAFKNRGSG